MNLCREFDLHGISISTDVITYPKVGLLYGYAPPMDGFTTHPQYLFKMEVNVKDFETCINIYRNTTFTYNIKSQFCGVPKISHQSTTWVIKYFYLINL